MALAPVVALLSTGTVAHPSSEASGLGTNRVGLIDPPVYCSSECMGDLWEPSVGEG